MRHRKQLDSAVRNLRQAAVVAVSAANNASRVAAQTNPDRMLRRWTAERTVEANRVLASRAGK